jgi:hypothetical protein
MQFLRHLIFAGAVKAFTACAFVATAILLIQVTPTALLYWLLVSQGPRRQILNTRTEKPR